MKRALFGSLLSVLAAAPAFAQRSPVDDVAFEQKLNAPVAADARFIDETGASVRFGDLLNGKPTVMMVGFYECPMLCDPILQNLAASLKRVDLTPGKDFNINTLSINPTEGADMAAGKKAELLKAYGRPETAAGWHVLTGQTDQIDKFTASIGYHFAPLPGNQYSHPAGLIMLTPDGHIDRYLIGMTFQPNDLRLGLVESSKGTIGTINDNILLRCYHYDPSTGKYGFAIQKALEVGGCSTAAILFLSIGWMSYRYRQRPEVRA